MSRNIRVSDHRQPGYPVESWIVNRWSPRALSGEEIGQEDLMTLFEAARWAPSSYNGQPWRFFYARRDHAHWDEFFDLMVEFNQGWAKDAAVLIVVVSRTTFEHNDKPAQTHSFDTGSAWENLALQASAMGLVAHGMQGFDYDKARQVLQLPDHYHVEAMVAVGLPGNAEDLPEGLREREKPSDRKPLEDIICEGPYQG